MSTDKKIIETKDKKVVLSTLWIFVMFNYIYCDVLSNMESGVLKELMAGHVGSIQVTQGFLLGGAILMEIPITMVLLSRILKYGVNRGANIVTSLIMAVVQFASLFVGTSPTSHYIFYSIIEITCDLFIAWYAWKWTNPVGE